VSAPEAVISVHPPTQILAADALAETTGSEAIVTETVPVAVHPWADVPVTVYNVFMFGQTFTVLPERLPGIHR